MEERGSYSSFKSPERKDSAYAKECRICMLKGDPNDIVKNACKCRGSMAFVHQSCLITWLNQKNRKYCELCKANFVLLEEYGPIRDIINKNLNYL